MENDTGNPVTVMNRLVAVCSCACLFVYCNVMMCLFHAFFVFYNPTIALFLMLALFKLIQPFITIHFDAYPCLKCSRYYITTLLNFHVVWFVMRLICCGTFLYCCLCGRYFLMSMSGRATYMSVDYISDDHICVAIVISLLW